MKNHISIRQLILVVGFIVLVVGLWAVKNIQEQYTSQSKANIAGVDISLKTPVTKLGAGETFVVDIDINPNAHKISAVELHIAYPGDDIEAISLVGTDLLPVVLSAGKITPGLASIILATQPSESADRGLSTPGTIARLTLKTKSTKTAIITVDPQTQIASIGNAGNVLGGKGSLTINGTTSGAQEPVTMHISRIIATCPGCSDMNPGTTHTFQIMIDTHGRPISAAEIGIQFPENIFEAVEIAVADALPLKLPLTQGKVELGSGEANIVAAIANPATPFIGTGVVAKLTLKIKESAPVGTTATISIHPDSKVATTDDLQNNALSVKDSPPAQFTIGASSPTKEPSSCKQTPDANGDGFVDIADFEVWRKEFNKEIETNKSDFNSDGKISLSDFECWRSALF